MRVTRHKKDITLWKVLPLPFVLTLVELRYAYC